MPRDSTGQYTYPPGTKGRPNTTIESARFNAFVDDITQDLNTPRPINAGGTGASNAAAAMDNLGGVSLDYLGALFRGLVSYFPMASPPEGWLICNGQAVSRTTYADLFAVIGTTYGSGNGSTTFNVPELRGEFIRGLDLDRGIDEDRELGSFQDQDVKAHTHTGSTSSDGAHTHEYAAATAQVGVLLASGSSYRLTLIADETLTAGAHSHTVTIPSSGGTESRPRNLAMVACIKT